MPDMQLMAVMSLAAENKDIVTIDWELFATIANFAILVIALFYVLYKPVMAMLEKREQQIAGAITGASAEKEEAERLKTEYTALLAQSRNEAQGIIDQARKQGEQMVATAEERADQEATRILERARAEIALERDKMLGEVRAQMATLAILAAEKLLEKNLDSETNRKLVNDFVAKVGDN